MVGDYLKCPLLSESIRRDFPRMKVIVPHDVGNAILDGSLIFGRRPLEVIVFDIVCLFLSFHIEYRIISSFSEFFMQLVSIRYFPYKFKQ